MAIKEKIKSIRDLERDRINASHYLSADEKLELTSLVTDAAECTNGYTEQEKVQNISETTFAITTLIVKIMEQLSENNELTKTLAQKVDNLSQVVGNRVKRDIRELSVKDTLKLVFVKPWIWVFLSVICFSPKGLQVLEIVMQHLHI